MEQYALITGATSGLGLAYAKRFAAEGYNLVITGRRSAVIKARAEEIRGKYGCSVQVVLVDLANENGVRDLLEQLGDKEIEVLVNNAGFGLRTGFADTEPGDFTRMIYLHTAAVAEITHFVLRGMRKRGAGTVINISSDGAFAVAPGNVVYAATKSFIITFTEGLHLELGGSGIRFQAVCPGFIDSDFHESAGMRVDKSAKGMFSFRSPGDVVEDAMRSLDKGEVVCVPDRSGRLIKALGTYLPRFLYYKYAKLFVEKNIRKKQ